MWYNLKNLKKKGINIRFFHYLNLNYEKLSNIVGVDNNVKGNLPFNFISFLKKLKKKCDYLILFDSKVSPEIQLELLPYVDCYLKESLFKDRSLYTKQLYGKRLFTDFYNRNYNINNNSNNLDKITLNPEYQHKISLWWNKGLSDYRPNNLLKPIFHSFFSKVINQKYHKPSIDRKFLMSANFCYKYNNYLDKLISFSFQRKQMIIILKKKYKFNHNVSLGLLPKKEYLKVLRSSQAVLSPFGKGAICYRDFEAFISGAALIKPHMDHLETWPDWYNKKFKTYIPISWKIENWENEITTILSDEKFLLKTARNGQEFYKSIWSEEGQEVFCERFIKMITPR